jgi:hypothetical protein
LIDIEGDDRAVSIARLEEQDDVDAKGEEGVNDAPPGDENVPDEPAEE